MESDCCGAYTSMWEYGLCPDCMEHCDFNEVEDEDPEMWQFEHSASIASEFINDVLLNQLDKFELDNDDETYAYLEIQLSNSTLYPTKEVMRYLHD